MTSQFSQFVIAGLVPAIPMDRALCHGYRDARVKPAHDIVRGMEIAR